MTVTILIFITMSNAKERPEKPSSSTTTATTTNTQTTVIDYENIRKNDKYELKDLGDWYVVIVVDVETFENTAVPKRMKIHFSKWKTKKYDKWIDVYSTSEPEKSPQSLGKTRNNFY